MRVLLIGALALLALAASMGCGGGASPLYVYLVPQAPADPALTLATTDELEANDVRVVHTFDELQATVKKRTHAVIIDRESLGIVDEQWLRGQLSAGVLIAGMRINFNELTEVLPTLRQTPWPFDVPTNERFYSYVLRCLKTDQLSEDADQLNLEVGPWTDLLAEIERVITSVEEKGFSCARTGD